MQKNKVLAGIIAAVLAVGTGVYHYVNYRAGSIVAEQIAVMNDSYAAMAAEGLMPGLMLSYQKIDANYWRNDYRISGLAIDVAALGTLANIAYIQVQGFKPGTLADSGSVQINGITLATGMQLLLPAALAELSNDLVLSTRYQYHYEADSGHLLLSQQLQLGEQFTAEYQLRLLQMQPLWQFARDLAAMDAETQQQYSQSVEYSEALNSALAQGSIQQGQLVLQNSGFLQALYKALGTSEQTAQLAALKPQLTQYLGTNALPEPVTAALQAFLAEPRYLKLAFALPQPLSFAQMQDEAFMAELQTAEQLIQFTHLQLTVNP